VLQSKDKSCYERGRNAKGCRVIDTKNTVNASGYQQNNIKKIETDNIKQVITNNINV